MGSWYSSWEQLILSMFFLFLIVLLIVNNGNILIDGTNERKYLQIKYNDL